MINKRYYRGILLNALYLLTAVNRVSDGVQPTA